MKSKKEEDKMDLTMFRDMLYNDNSISDELSSKKLQKQIAYGIKRRKIEPLIHGPFVKNRPN